MDVLIVDIESGNPQFWAVRKITVKKEHVKITSAYDWTNSILLHIFKNRAVLKRKSFLFKKKSFVFVLLLLFL